MQAEFRENIEELGLAKVENKIISRLQFLVMAQDSQSRTWWQVREQFKGVAVIPFVNISQRFKVIPSRPSLPGSETGF